MKNFSNMSGNEMSSHYMASKWNTLTDSEKRELLQETVNRQAKALGMQDAPTVTIQEAAKMDGASASFSPTTGIEINRDILSDLDPLKSKACGFNSLESTLHELRHAYQTDVVAGKAPAEHVGQREIFEANQPRIIDVNGQPGLTSIRDTGTDISYILYRLNPRERDAVDYSQRVTEAVAAHHEAGAKRELNGALIRQRLGVDTRERVRHLSGDLDGIDEYRYDANIYSVALQKEIAEDVYGISSQEITQSIDNKIANMYDESRGLPGNRPVNRTIDMDVERVSHESYAQIHRQLQADMNQPRQNIHTGVHL